MHQSLITKFTTALFLIVAIILPTIVHAQDPGGGPDVAIDGGLSLLVAAGVGYGVKKVRDERRRKKTPKP